jgi:hypothetical protein
MTDIHCRKCGDTWDSYGIRMAVKYDKGDMTREEAIKFVKGEGCPSCHFGKDIKEINKDIELEWFLDLYDKFSG